MTKSVKSEPSWLILLIEPLWLSLLKDTLRQMLKKFLYGKSIKGAFVA